MFPRSEIPQLRFHKPTNRFYVWDSARKTRKYLGSDRALAERKYQLIIATIRLTPTAQERLTGPPPPLPLGPVAFTVAEAFMDYLNRHARGYFQTGSSFCMARTALSAAADRYGNLPAVSFGPRELKQLQQEWIKEKCRAPRNGNGTWSRQYVNGLIKCVRRAFRWLVTESIVPPSVAEALNMVPDIRKGRGGREAVRVTPAPAWAVEATLPYCRPTLRAMLMLQRAAGMRPQDVCGIRPCDVSREPATLIPLPGTRAAVCARVIDGVTIWAYVPESHKTLAAGKPRAVAFGPRAQEILRPYLESVPAGECCFQPRQLREEYHAERRAARKSKVQPSQVCRATGYRTRPPGMRFTSQAYSQALRKAIDRANVAREAAGISPPIPHWAPNQLRHEAGTLIGDVFDRSTAAAVLGHSGLSAIDIYCEQSLGKAFMAAAALG